MSWFQSQFDKLLMAGLGLGFCVVALYTQGSVQAFALTTAGGCVACLMTLVTARRNSSGDPPETK